MRHSRQYDFQGHPRSGSRSVDDLSPLLGLFFNSLLPVYKKQTDLYQVVSHR